MPGTVPGSGVLDGPPPAPGANGNTPGQPAGQVAGQMPTLSSFAGPQPIGSGQMPPEVLTGMLQAGEKIGSMFDSFAQVTPDLAGDWDMLKDMLQRTLGKVLAAGGSPTSPTAVGSQFPGGGLDKGMP